MDELTQLKINAAFQKAVDFHMKENYTWNQKLIIAVGRYQKGNIVKIKHKHKCFVEEVYHNSIVTSINRKKIKKSKVWGVPFSKKDLVSLGYEEKEKNKWYYTKSDNKIFKEMFIASRGFGILWQVRNDKGSILPLLNCIHEIQNLHMALAGEELIYKL